MVTIIYLLGWGGGTSDMPNTGLDGEHLYFLIKLNTQLLYNSVIPLVGIYPEETKTEIHTHKNMCNAGSNFIHNHPKDAGDVGDVEP